MAIKKIEKAKLRTRAGRIKAPEGWKRSEGMGFRDGRDDSQVGPLFLAPDTEERNAWVMLVSAFDHVTLVFNFSDEYEDVTGSTYFENDGSWYSFDQRGIDSSFNATFAAKPKSYEHALDVDAIIAEQLDRVAKSRSLGGQVDVPGLPGISIRKTKVDKVKSKLKGGEPVSLTPAGMGVGYRLATRKPRVGWWQPASSDTAKFFSVPRLFFEAIDHD